MSEVSDEVDNIVASEYIRLLRASDNNTASNAPYYFGDEFRVISQSPDDKHALNFYQDFEHQWTVKNTGTVTWENRYLECTNQSEIRIKARSNTIKIPKVKPGDETLLNIEFNSRGIEGKYEALWQMKDSDGNSCFPDKNKALRVEAVVENICKNTREA